MAGLMHAMHVQVEPEFRLKALVQHATKSFMPETPHRQIARAIYPGDEERLRRVVAKMYRGPSVPESVKAKLHAGSRI